MNAPPELGGNQRTVKYISFIIPWAVWFFQYQDLPAIFS